MADGLAVSRRSFLKLLGLAGASGLVIPALTPPRDPYVVAGEVVSYIGLGQHSIAFGQSFIGGALVHEVGTWDGVGYPCVLRSQGYSRHEPFMPHRFYDTDLAAFNREVPHHFWHHDANWQRYKNVHEYVRERRYGDIPSKLLAQAWAIG
jgi:hypothetical protein